MDMEEIFYAVLALHIAGKPVNRENIKAILKAVGTPIDEKALDAMVLFVETLEAARRERQRTIDPRIIKFLTDELERQKVKTERLEALLDELTKSVTLSEAYEFIPSERDTAEAEEITIEETESIPRYEGRYVYGVAMDGREVNLGPIGIDGNEVYTIPYRGLSVIVHNCPPEPYQSNDDEIVKNWIRTHQNVLDVAKEQFGTIIPMGFDIILQPDDATSPDQVVRDWLKEDYDRLLTVMEKIEGRDEYGVQIFYDPKVIGELIAKNNGELEKLKEEIATKSPGLAYMYKQKMEKLIKEEMERLAEEWFRDFYSRIKRHCDDIVIEKTKKVEKDKIMLINPSCLVVKENVESLGEELEKINSIEGFSVRFTGPWPPYSFVSKPTITTSNIGG